MNAIKIDREDFDNIEEVVDYIIAIYHEDCEVVIGELLNQTIIVNATVEEVVEIWAKCMSKIEGDTIVQYYNDCPNYLDDKSDYDGYEFRIIGGK